MKSTLGFLSSLRLTVAVLLARQDALWQEGHRGDWCNHGAVAAEACIHDFSCAHLLWMRSDGLNVALCLGFAFLGLLFLCHSVFSLWCDSSLFWNYSLSTDKDGFLKLSSMMIKHDIFIWQGSTLRIRNIKYNFRIKFTTKQRFFISVWKIV